MKTDIRADNGMIHMVGDVLYPIPEGNIAEVVTGDDRFSTLLAAVGAAGQDRQIKIIYRGGGIRTNVTIFS